MIDVVEVGTQKDLDDFILFPVSLYGGDPYYVPPLIREIKKQLSEKNPFFHHAEVRYFLACKENKIQGRIASIINHHHNEFHHEKTGFFGFFDSINDQVTAAILLNTVSSELANKGMKSMRGPVNFSTNEECGLLIEGFHTAPMLMTPYNPPYYRHLMEYHGMAKGKDLFAYICDIPKELPKKVLRVADIAEKSGVTVRPVEKKHFVRDMKIFQEVYNSAWEKNWGFVPLTDDELLHLAENLKTIISATERFGPIDGVIHAAGLPGGGAVQFKSRETAMNVLRAKVQGTRVLVEALGDQHPEFIVLCSSVNGVIGVFGQVDYCAANAFLDAFAHYHKARTGSNDCNQLGHVGRCGDGL